MPEHNSGLFKRARNKVARLLAGGKEEEPSPLDPSPKDMERLIDLSAVWRRDGTYDQSQSLFFTRLPIEIRYHIYSLVLPPEKRIWVRKSPYMHPRRASSRKRNDPYIVEHFPCVNVLSNLTWLAPREKYECTRRMYADFFGHVNDRRVEPHMDTLSLLKTCQRIYLELYDICTFCFDDMECLDQFTKLYPALPMRHLQVVLYPKAYLFFAHQSTIIPTEQITEWRAKVASLWEQELRDVNAACSRVTGLTTLLVSLHPLYPYLQNQERVFASLEVITATPILYVEILGEVKQEPILCRAGGEVVWSIPETKAT